MAEYIEREASQPTCNQLATTCNDYIKRSYLRKMAMLEMVYTMETETDAAVVLRMIDDAPAADVAPVRHARWVKDYDGDEYCENCSRYMLAFEVTHDPSAHNYCPNCGAKMDLEV